MTLMISDDEGRPLASKGRNKQTSKQQLDKYTMRTNMVHHMTSLSLSLVEICGQLASAPKTLTSSRPRVVGGLINTPFPPSRRMSLALSGGRDSRWRRGESKRGARKSAAQMAKTFPLSEKAPRLCCLANPPPHPWIKGGHAAAAFSCLDIKNVSENTQNKSSIKKLF